MDKDKNNNFTPRARKVVELARAEARRFNHNYVGTEHILLGLIKLGQGVAVNVLQKLRTLGQQRGIFWVEVGVATTVSGVMLKIFYMFAARGNADDE